MKITGIIFSNTKDIAMGELTRKRATASLPIGGRYRLIDFMLSNLVNSGIHSVGVLTKYNYRSLLDHLGSGSEWDLDRKNGGLFILPPFTSVDQISQWGSLEAMYNAIPFLKRVNSEFVILCDASVVCKINFDEVVEHHVESGKDVTIVVKSESEDYKCDKDDIAVETKDGEVKEIFVGLRGSANNPVGTGIYVMARDMLTNVVETYVSKGRYNFEKDFLQSEFVSRNISVSIFEFSGTVLRNKDPESYFKNNLMLMSPDIRNEFFGSELPIFTKVRNEVPTIYGERSDVSDCFVADGCRISGKAKNSVIFRDVTLEEGASVQNCIIMQGSKICSGARVKNAIVEKNTFVSGDAFFSGAENSPVIVK